MDPNLGFALNLFAIVCALVAIGIFRSHMRFLQGMQGRYPMYAQQWSESVWHCKFGMGVSAGVAVGAVIYLAATW